MGTRLRFALPGTITAIRFYAPTPYPGDGASRYTVELWDVVGTRLAYASPATLVAGWNTVSLSVPVAVDTGTYYIATTHNDDGHYVATAGFFNTPLTNGNITAPATSSGTGNGLFATNVPADTFPNQSFNGGCYFVDAVYEAASYTPPVVTNPGNKTGVVGTPITPFTLAASGGTGGPYTWAATNLPPGLDIGTSTGQVSGTPTTAGIYTVTATADDGTGEGSTEFVFTVASFADGWTTRLIAGLAEHLAAAGIGTWRASGAYTAGETAIVDRAVPPEPDRLITLAAYPMGSTTPGLADHDVGVQVRLRAGTDPRDCDDLADQIFEALDGLSGVTLGGIPIVQMWRQSYTSLGQDGNSRWERSENYYIQAMRPTSNNTD
jgi:hypothetical protein